MRMTRREALAVRRDIMNIRPLPSCSQAAEPLRHLEGLQSVSS